MQDAQLENLNLGVEQDGPVTAHLADLARVTRTFRHVAIALATVDAGVWIGSDRMTNAVDHASKSELDAWFGIVVAIMLTLDVIPIVTLGMLLHIAFKTWKMHRKIDRLPLEKGQIVAVRGIADAMTYRILFGRRGYRLMKRIKSVLPDRSGL